MSLQTAASLTKASTAQHADFSIQSYKIKQQYKSDKRCLLSLTMDVGVAGRECSLKLARTERYKIYVATCKSQPCALHYMMTS